MDSYIFGQHLEQCNSVEEKTSYLEIFNYSDPEYDTCEEHALLTDDDFDNFVRQTGTFSPDPLPEGVKLQDGIRLIVQKDAVHVNTFAPLYISLKKESYELMVRAWHLPFRAIEGSSLVGPFFWCSHDQNEDDRHLQIIFRKSDVRKKGKTRGWEIMLSYSYKTGITSGFVKGTESSDIVNSLKQLLACRAEVRHPLLLPIIILSHDLSAKGDKRQRDARDWLRRLENAITMRNEIDERETYSDFDVDGINRDLVECHSQVLWKRPQAYQEIIKEVKGAMDNFMKYVPEHGRNSKTLMALHDSMMGRLDFYRVKLTGMEHYIHTTLERLHIQRQALYNIMAQKESKLNLEIASQQRRVAHATKRDGTAMKTLSLLGAVFLPGTFMASVFSMTFFDFNVGPSDGGSSSSGSNDTSGDGATVSKKLWVYFAVTVPLTVIILLFWYYLDRKREKRYEQEDVEIEKGIDRMEKDILAIMRKKTINKVTTWNSGGHAASPTPNGSARRERLLARKDTSLDDFELV
ncbi:uncharacterized protein GGS22DRAFT_178431 [Annulohypoxylon maeteangense]|uniref:uncharacterized protein n=1 Tax=Annulohypoxylon maeteangense TaxID=1927788 RepID=UPI002008E1F1|nr:uncharacterized protein GGS22DRAFT_178431 [Annulohypoxylon maeteangense]KAI0887238.1 hypothetical protein GGS22DRAFT_178431 [Annulohypoxylon maeteangense]